MFDTALLGIACEQRLTENIAPFFGPIRPHSTGTGKPFPSLRTGNSVFVVRLVKRIGYACDKLVELASLKPENTMSEVEREVPFQP